VPNQELFIAAASQITECIRMGPMVKLLTLHHPVSLIEDLCVADNLTNGASTSVWAAARRPSSTSGSGATGPRRPNGSRTCSDRLPSPAHP
jgi:hypothetical protein